MREERLKHVAEIHVSNVDKKSFEGDVPVSLCNYTDVYYNERITGSLDFMFATATRDQRATFGLTRGDVVLTKDSETAEDIGVSALVAEDVPDLVCGYHLAVVRARAGSADGGYLRWVLASTAARQRMSAAATGVTRFGLRSEAIADLPVPLPPFGHQRAIAEYLDRETGRIDALISAKRRLMELLEERWQVVMHDAVAGMLVSHPHARRATSVPWLTDVPGHWREGLLKLVATLGSGHTPSRSHPEWWVDLTIPWITTGEVAQMRSDRIELITDTRERISELGMANSSAALRPAGTVVLCRTASAGYSSIMGSDMATSQDFATWTCGPLLRPRFLLLCLRAMRADLLGRLAMGSTHQTIYMPDIEAIKLPIPPVEEQDAIVSAVYSHQRSLDACSVNLGDQIGLLQERRQALITAAVTGQLSLPEAA